MSFRSGLSELTPVSMRTLILKSATTLLTSPMRRRMARDGAALAARLRGERPTVRYFHQADDPYSHLAAQMLPRLRARYAAEIEVHLAPPPEDSAAPDRERLRGYGLRDAVRLARAHDLEFPSNPALPAPEAVLRLQAILADALDRDRFDATAAAAGNALWSGDMRALEVMAAPNGAAEPGLADQSLAAGEATRRRLGHYLGGMFHFEGEWFWGVDRLGWLERRLADRGLDREPGARPLAPALEPTLEPFPIRLNQSDRTERAPIQKFRAFFDPITVSHLSENALDAPPAGSPPTLEVWFSFRSPYSWLVMPRIRRLARAYGAPLELRPILPMVMRGLAVPRIKTLYIALDSKREAERLGLPFGAIVDPVGAGAERALAVLHHAIPLGLGQEFAELGLKAAFADGIALAEDRGLFDVARRAGLTDAQTAAALADDTWRTRVEGNRAALLDAGLWGVPAFRVSGGPAHWGQDRLWMLEQDLREALSPAPGGPKSGRRTSRADGS